MLHLGDALLRPGHFTIRKLTWAFFRAGRLLSQEVGRVSPLHGPQSIAAEAFWRTASVDEAYYVDVPNRAAQPGVAQKS